LGMAVDDFIVPVVCDDPHRTAMLRQRLYELRPAEQESSIFWVSDRTRLDLTQPQQLLYGDVWITAAGEQGSIFAQSHAASGEEPRMPVQGSERGLPHERSG
jgi:hypothetical protein